MTDEKITFEDKILRSTQFDDVYFSPQDGLAETRHIFMSGNGLPEAWQHNDTAPFCIFEAGFGTGLNFLCAFDAFMADIKAGKTARRLDFISCEKYPLKPDIINAALEPWDAELGEYKAQLLDHYPIRTEGFHRIVFNKYVTLTLIIGDINDYIPEINASVDCWFLDGFTPAKNPEMWSDTLFENMTRLSKSAARVATFTAAKDVGQGLTNAGFDVTKVRGFGHKRTMFSGVFKTDQKPHLKPKTTPKIAIIGAGLAGAAAAFALKQYGLNATIFEAGDDVALGASGNAIGLYNPRFTALKDTNSEFYSAGFAQLLRTLNHAHQNGADIDYNPCGALHLINTPEKQKRFDKLIQNWGWHNDHARLVTADEATKIAGVPIDLPAFYLPQSGSVSPQKLCHYYTQDIDLRLNTRIESLDDLKPDFDHIVIANGFDAARLLDAPDLLPIHTVRGQVTQIKSSGVFQNLKCNICYGGYLSAPINGVHTVGSSFQKWLDHTDVLPEDNAANLTRMTDNIPAFKNERTEVTTSRAGLRVASHDRFPLVGAIPNRDNTYISTAFGSHGIVGSLAAAHLISDLIRGGAFSLPQSAITHLNPQRFLDRLNKKQDKQHHKKR